MYASRLVCRELGIPDENVLIVSDRNHAYRIRTALNLFSKQKNGTSRRFLKDNVNILLQQYHGALIEAQSTVAGKKKFADAAEVTDLLRDLDIVDERDKDARSLFQATLKARSSLILQGPQYLSMHMKQKTANIPGAISGWPTISI